MVTNGYCLTQKVSTELYLNGVTIFQVTVDGIADIHNQRRPLKNGQGTFEKIIQNIKSNNKLKCYLNLVYDDGNVSGFYDLIDYLVEEKITNKIDLINLSSVKPIISDNHGSCVKPGYAEDADERIDMIKYICYNGFKTSFDLDFQLCTMKQKSSVVITPDLSIYKCISGVGDKDFLIGSIDSPNTDPFDMQNKIIENDNNKRCSYCCYMPICNKFCLYEAKISQNGDVVCNRDFFDEYVPKYLKLLLDEKCSKNIVLDSTREEWGLSYL